MADKTTGTRQGELSAAASGTFTIGEDLTINRLGFGAMRITGEGVWGEPKDHDQAIRVLQRAVELGIDFIDTADSYGPEVSERLIAEALHPYPANLVIATKAGFDRPGAGKWVMNGRPEHLREACEGSLKRLRLERIDLYQLHRIDPAVPAEDQIGTLADLQQEGKIKHIGLSEVSVEQVRHAWRIARRRMCWSIARHKGLGLFPGFRSARGNWRSREERWRAQRKKWELRRRSWP